MWTGQQMDRREKFNIKKAENHGSREPILCYLTQNRHVMPVKKLRFPLLAANHPFISLVPWWATWGPDFAEVMNNNCQWNILGITYRTSLWKSQLIGVSSWISEKCILFPGLNELKIPQLYLTHIPWNIMNIAICMNHMNKTPKYENCLYNRAWTQK